jgi:hypothetical protein
MTPVTATALIAGRGIARSNTLEDAGVIADRVIGTSQLTFIRAALQRVKREKYKAP